MSRSVSRFPVHAIVLKTLYCILKIVVCLHSGGAKRKVPYSCTAYRYQPLKLLLPIVFSFTLLIMTIPTIGLRLTQMLLPFLQPVHASIDGALELAIQYNIKPEDIVEVAIYTNEIVLETAGGPFVIRTDPEVDAKFSILYVVAVALTKKEVALDDFQAKTIRKPELAQLADKVKVVVDPEFKDSRSTVGPIKIRIKMRDGEELSRRVEFARGHLKNPMSEPESSKKFRDCVRQSAKPMSEQNIERLLTMMSELEKVDYLAKLLRLTT